MKEQKKLAVASKNSSNVHFYLLAEENMLVNS